jgi:hypothetical protein
VQIGRLIFAAVLATATAAYFVWKYRAAIPAFDGWSDLAHRSIKTFFAVGLICCLTGCALFSDNAQKRAELKRQLGELASSGLTSLVTGNPLPAVGGAISFIGYLFGATGAAYAIRQRHKFRQAVADPPGFPVGPPPASVSDIPRSEMSDIPPGQSIPPRRAA